RAAGESRRRHVQPDSDRPRRRQRSVASARRRARAAAGGRLRPLPTAMIVRRALTIAGSDSGGGAGIQADLKTFLALGVHGTSALTGVTAQNPRRVRSVQPAPATLLQQQLEAVFDELPPAAVKSGMLCSATSMRVIARFLGRR